MVAGTRSARTTVAAINTAIPMATPMAFDHHDVGEAEAEEHAGHDGRGARDQTA